MSVGRWISEPLRVFKRKTRKAHSDRVLELMDLTGLEKDCLRKRPHQLSGGQAQRAAIARALSLNPRILLCDEILSGLDSLHQVQVLDLLKKLQGETGLTVLFVSHDLAAVGYLCHRLAVLKDDKILEETTTNEFLRKPQHPYSVRLLDSAF
jgi:peptide/nickel transport system ATP-binding protein